MRSGGSDPLSERFAICRQCLLDTVCQADPHLLVFIIYKMNLLNSIMPFRLTKMPRTCQISLKFRFEQKANLQLRAWRSDWSCGSANKLRKSAQIASTEWFPLFKIRTKTIAEIRFMRTNAISRRAVRLCPLSRDSVDRISVVRIRCPRQHLISTNSAAESMDEQIVK